MPAMRFSRFSLLSGGAAVLFALFCAFLAYEEGNGWLLWLAAVPLLAWRSGAGDVPDGGSADGGGTDGCGGGESDDAGGCGDGGGGD
ncbi:hypothetical protein C8244_16565 [Paracidovorax avenae]|nr:hypothetical protein C8244_16565 [Paracidovorax avenae]